MSNSDENTDYETKAIHAGQEYEQWSNQEIIPPIVTTLTFYQDDPTNMQVYFQMHTILHRKRYIGHLLRSTFFHFRAITMDVSAIQHVIRLNVVWLH